MVAAQTGAQGPQLRDLAVDAGDGGTLAARHRARLRVGRGRQRGQQVRPGEIQRTGHLVGGVGEALARPHEIPVAEHHALGVAGGAAGVDQRGQAVGGERGAARLELAIGDVLARRGQRADGVVVHHPDRAQVGRLGPEEAPLNGGLSAHNAHLNKQIVVDAHGMTMYRLKPETTRHLLCRSQLCLTVWKPLTVRSSSTSAIKAGPGVTGRLGLLRRGRNSYQVTLRGMPLYHYISDTRRGQANGENIATFGGVWHAVPPSTTTKTTPPPTTTMPPPTTTYPPY